MNTSRGTVLTPKIQVSSSVGTSQTPKIDARAHKSKVLIWQALQGGLAKRSMNLRPTEICRVATITRPTFYQHCRSSDDALQKYEQSLRQKFSHRMVVQPKEKKVTYTLLLGFIREEQGYFAATMPNHDYFLLSQLLARLKTAIVGKKVSAVTFELYAHQQLALISCWVCRENFDLERVPFYAQKLAETRVTDYGIRIPEKAGQRANNKV